VLCSGVFVFDPRGPFSLATPISVIIDTQQQKVKKDMDATGAVKSTRRFWTKYIKR
jgi:hypothetical protein